ncbi:hypothetical protein [Nocardioides sp. URHA0020]|uniref:hypothetical protein n=1 Tax=Nocardioides sp. URHA0020 TaxID=1380392 RepID=UPI000685EF04|nr:hypothetical protein [Nocardioides sp. URHA0020]
MIRALVTLAAVLACAGCSGSSDEPTAAPSTSTSTGSTSPSPTPVAQGREISGTGYVFHAPRGWRQPSRSPSGFDLDSFAVDPADRDGFTDNVNVILSPAGDLTPAQAETLARRELAAGSFEDIVVQDRVDVSGSETAHLSASASTNGTDYAVEQFYPTNDGQTFVVTFSFSADLAGSERAKVTDSVLASWAWTD